MDQATAYDGFARDKLPPQSAWPELRFDLPELQYPSTLNCTAALLEPVIARGDGHRMALMGESESLTYDALRDRVDRIVTVLRDELGLVPGNRVLLRGANNPMTAACMLAIWKAGCIAVPTMPLLRARELAVLLCRSQANAVLCAADLATEMDKGCHAAGWHGPVVHFGDNSARALERRCARVAPRREAEPTGADEVCLLAFTSGTTGIPKATMHFHRDVLAVCDTFSRHVLKPGRDDVFIGTPPLAFTFGLGGLLLFPLHAGAASVLLEKPTPEAVLSAMAAHRATISFTAPTFYRLMSPLAAAHDLSALAKSVSAGEALPLSTRRMWETASGADMIDGIGSTEMLHIFISASGSDIRPGATGKPVPGYVAAVLDEQGRELGPGQVGRLAVKGPTGCRYMDDERQSVYVNNGWNITGDAYEIDQDGYFWYRARTDDMIVSGGYNIGAPEVEDALLAHPAVAECGVIGAPSEERGQIVKAYVVLKPDWRAGEDIAVQLQSFVKETIAPYKYPRAIVFVENLPRTNTGKLQRFRLRELDRNTPDASQAGKQASPPVRP